MLRVQLRALIGCFCCWYGLICQLIWLRQCCHLTCKKDTSIVKKILCLEFNPAVTNNWIKSKKYLVISADFFRDRKANLFSAPQIIFLIYFAWCLYLISVLHFKCWNNFKKDEKINNLNPVCHFTPNLELKSTIDFYFDSV